ncbi:ribonucleases P/MRP protein subunit POP1 [Gouania willdenowi]|uniref:ribonucleases P/MRP protein subunit POP1 n=1 Tax=Gouania willdenowi TaxID=441366 RepID=UPI001055EDE0|nr:ribonucleases P/MRP protein subunit POP1 [Gouania willdenowi]
MSAAKVKMREKKLRNQPSNVQYSSTHSVDNSDARQGGWVRGHHRDAGGYAKEMPKFITGGTFARARAAEVNAMLKAVNKTPGSSYVFAALPKHMRRRAMSHNTKRLPRRLRDVANRMREKTYQAATKKKKEQAKNKSRKARRRHGNLLLEFNRRQRKNIWLETHIWHAKRFHMVKKWGYCLGDRPTNKCYRPCYRAMSNHCLLQDLSYYCCIELHGEEDKLLAALSQLTSKDTGPTFASAVCLSGCRQGSLTVYKAGQYPSHPLGLVTFLWRPRTQGSALRQLWIWAHPTLKQDLLAELQAVCLCSEAVAMVTPVEAHPTTEPEPEKSSEAKLVPGKKRKRNHKDSSEPSAKKILGDGTRSTTSPVTWKSSLTGIIINDLTMELVRFRLIGPQSHSVLTDTLEAATRCEVLCKEQQPTHTSSLWWPELCKDESRMKLHQQQADLFHTLKSIFSSSELTAGTVLSLTVDDPRLNLPTKKVQALPCVQQAEEVCEEKRRELTLRGVPEHCCQSFLWDQSVRNSVTDNKIPEQTLNRMRREVLVPGSRLSPTPLQGRVPILLVHQPGKQLGTERTGWGAGWDLLLPKGWGMAFWVPLVYRGVRVGGLNMSLKHNQNKATPHFPHDYPDCPAGVRFQDEQEAELLNKLKRRPPAKRPNYIKLGCLAPLRCPWQQLAEEWELISRDLREEKTHDGPVEQQVSPLGGATVKPQHFTVLRSRSSLRLLSCWCRPSSSKGQRLRGVGESSPLSHSAASALVEAHRMSVVWVRLSLLSKGKPELHAMLCAPTAEDLRLLAKEQRANGPQEPPHKDHFKSRIGRSKKSQKTASPANDTSQSSDLVIGLWPDPLPSVSSHCSRVMLGWVTQGDFSLSAGCGEALGFITVSGLIHTLIKQPVEHRGTLLLRNPASLHYRFIKVNIEV